MKRIISIFLILTMMLSISAFLSSCEPAFNKIRYSHALELLDLGDYQMAYELFVELDDYEDSKLYASRFHFVRILETVSYEVDGESVQENLVVTLNEKNLPSRMVDQYSEGFESTDYEYDEVGNIVKQIFTMPDGTVEISELEYNEDNMLTKHSTTLENGDVYTLELKYNENGQYYRGTYTTPNGDVSTITIRYNEDGEREETVHKTNYKTTSNTKFFYDDKGNLVKEVTTDSSGQTEICEYTYDENGNNTKFVIYHANGATSTYDFFYDKDGNVTHELFLNSEGESYHDQFFYDENGNVVKMISKINGSEVTVYEYTYEFLYIPYDLPRATLDALEIK